MKRHHLSCRAFHDHVRVFEKAREETYIIYNTVDSLNSLNVIEASNLASSLSRKNLGSHCKSRASSTQRFNANRYGVGRYISLERLIEQSKETYYEALQMSSARWHEEHRRLKPWWEYSFGVLIGAYREFEERVGTITTARGAKREMVRQAIEGLSDQFTMKELRRACPGVSPDMVRVVLREFQKDNLLACIGHGPGALWRKKGNSCKKG